MSATKNKINEYVKIINSYMINEKTKLKISNRNNKHYIEFIDDSLTLLFSSSILSELLIFLVGYQKLLSNIYIDKIIEIKE